MTVANITKTGNKSKKRDRPFRKRYVVSLFPRVIKRDIRRMYPRMLANLVNGCDPEQLLSFFATYSVASMEFRSEFQNKEHPVADNGVYGLVSNIIAEQELMPDFTLSIKRAYVKQFLFVKDKSQIIVEVHCSGTKIYEYDPKYSDDEDSASLTLQIMDETLNSLRTSENEVAFSLAKCQENSKKSIENSTARKILSTQPFKVVIQGFLTLDLDENHRIQHFQFSATLD